MRAAGRVCERVQLPEQAQVGLCLVGGEPAPGVGQDVGVGPPGLGRQASFEGFALAGARVAERAGHQLLSGAEVVDEHARAHAHRGGEVAQRHGDHAALEQVIGGSPHDRLAALVVDGPSHGEVRYLVTSLRQ